MRRLSARLGGCGGRSFLGRLVPFDRFRFGHERLFQHVAHMGDRNDLEPFLHVVRNVGQILDVLFGDEDRLDPAAQGREQLFLQPADGHGIAAQRHLARHGDILAHRDLRQHRHDRGHHGEARGRTVLGRRPVRHVDVDVPAVELRRLHPDLGRDGPDIGACGVDRFLHHVAQFPGRLHPALARQAQGFDLEKIAAHAGPGQPGHNADLVFLLGQTVAVFAHAQIVFQRLPRDLHLLLVFAHDLGHGLACQFRDVAFEVPHPRLAGVIADDVGQGAVGHLELALAKPVVLDLLVDEVLLGDLALFVFGVARQRNDLHPVQKRAGHVVGVRRGQEHHVRQVVFHFEIVVHEGRVLLRVEHFEHRRGRVAAEILPHLVDFIEQDERVRGLGLFQRLNDLAGHRADIGPAVTANFAFVTHAAQRDANELAPRGLGDRFAQRRLTDTRRTDEAHDRPLQLFRALLHGEVFDDPFLDLLKPVMVVVQNLLRVVEVLLHAAFHAPRDRQHPVEVVAHDRRLGAHRAHVLELLELRIGLFAGLFRQLGRVDAVFQFLKLVLAFAVLAQFLLDRLHLFVQVILPLRALHLALHARLDLLFDLKNGHFALHQAIDLLKPLVDREGFQKILLLVDFHAKMTGHEVGEFRRFAGLGHRRKRLFRDVLLHLGIAFEFLTDRPHERLGGGFVTDGFDKDFGLGLEEVGVGQEFVDLHPRLAFDQHLHGAVGQFEQLQDVCQNACAVDAVFVRVVDRRVDLARQQDLLVVRHHLFQCLHALLATDEERHDHMRKDHDVAQRQDRMDLC
ncbi:hypothetical protein RB2654_03349 [Maritimibacter alkaliphilus HTCC2654]|uniref:Uncharacterized protein n=1 Tax=Maritimibacter alkaliphilus HTCC2654 TaxID=314271 RepID=A3VDX8_9RHOB|nr:hypothetical protein RB2654_03349 [Maritimibacter alkaliphilus HTCC2654]